MLPWYHLDHMHNVRLHVVTIIVVLCLYMFFEMTHTNKNKLTDNLYTNGELAKSKTIERRLSDITKAWDAVQSGSRL